MKRYRLRHDTLSAGTRLSCLRTCWPLLLLSLLWLIGAAPQPQAGGPIPYILPIDLPSELEPGKPFELEVRAINQGADAEGGGSITISLPEEHDIAILASDVEILPEGWSNCDYSGPHAWVVEPDAPCHRALQHNTACRGQVDVNYPLAETWHKPWRSGEEHFVRILVSPRQDTRYVTVYVRVAMRVGTRGCDLRLEPNESNADSIDQQGFPVKSLLLAVRTPTSTPAPLLTSTDTPEPPTPWPVPTIPAASATPVPPTPAVPPSRTPTLATAAALPAGTPGAGMTPEESAGGLPVPILGALACFILAGLLWLVIAGGRMLLSRGQQPGPQPAPPHLSGGGSAARPSPRPLPPLPPLEPKCLQCGANLRVDALFCRACGAPIRVIASRYPILRRLGKGGMGAVYLVRDNRIPGKRWAMKEMSDAAIADLLERQQAIDAFRQEAQLLATLDHVNLPRVTDFLSEAGCHYLVMDFVEGETLENLLSRQTTPFSEAQVLDWAGQLCDVLSYLHARQPPVIFRDLKPGNIMLTPDGHLKLIDFGIARFFKPGQATDTIRFGTPGYAPPEQYGKGQTDHRSDVYALGVTMHQLLTLHDPAATPFVLPPVRKVNSRVTPRTEAAIQQATQLETAQRFQAAADMKRALGLA